MIDGSNPIQGSDAEEGARSLSLLSAEIPPGWIYKESYTFLAPDGGANVIMSSEPVIDDLDSEAYANMQGSILEAEFPQYEQLTLAPYVIVGVNGHGWLRTFTWTPLDGNPVQQTQLYVVLFGRGCTATATSTVSKYERHRAVISTILRSMAVHAENAEQLQRRISKDI